MKDHIVSPANYGKPTVFYTGDGEIVNTVFGNPAGEKNTLPSQTIPGMTLSLEELLKRYVKQGINYAPPESLFFGEDDFIPDGLELMDEMERLDFSNQLKQGIEVERERLSRPKKQAEVPLPQSSSAEPYPSDVDVKK